MTTNSPEYQRRYRERNAEKLKAYHREWELANPKRRKEHKRKCYLKRKASGKIDAYREANKEQIKAYQAAYQVEYQKEYNRLRKKEKPE